MPSLKDLKSRINSVKSTKKITSAMKMVAASKLRRAQDQAEAGQPYADRMAGMLARLSDAVSDGSEGPPLLVGTGADKTHLLIVITANRGLCGGFNTNVAREARRHLRALTEQGKDVKLLMVGRKGYDLLKTDCAPRIVDRVFDLGQRGLSFEDAQGVATKVLDMFERGEFDVATLWYSRFVNVVSQKPTKQQLIPFEAEADATDAAKDGARDSANAAFEFEPDEEAILRQLLPRNVAVQIYRALLDSAAGEQAARMTAMDNATRNAGEMIDDLTLTYNRERQAYITKELIEIISGAEAV